MGEIRSIAVYCGASDRVDEAYLEAAWSFGELLARRGITVVYGGGDVGLMGRLANGALSAGGEVIGVITEQLQILEVGHSGLTELLVVQTMSERKTAMSARADAVVALPGGWGTLEELFEVVTWTQLEIYNKPAGLLDIKGYFKHLDAFLDHATTEGFIRPSHRSLLQTASDPEELLDRLMRAL
ncbi:MAG: TIGR00730 family Rossman fold protein [Myxococcota bacterium]|nr:TIGR00730 family Rossman fold protein [Myxococcota bacterium]